MAEVNFMLAERGRLVATTINRMRQPWFDACLQPPIQIRIREDEARGLFEYLRDSQGKKDARFDDQECMMWYGIEVVW